MKKLALCSRKFKKLCNVTLLKKEYMYLLPLISLHDFCLEKTLTCYFDLLAHFSRRLGVIATQNGSPGDIHIYLGLECSG